MTGQKQTTPPLRWRIQLWCAKHLGAYRYGGLICFAEMRGYPMARVQYEDGISRPMAMGNAVDYAKNFNGVVIP